MGKSFKDQLLELGLVDKKKVADVKRKHHQAKKKKGKGGAKQEVVDENALLAQKAEEKKKARARELNKEREAKLQKRAEDARIKQLIEQHKIDKEGDGIAYRFNVSGKIHRIFVAQDVLDQIGVGRLGIVACVGSEERFEVIPREIVEKIQAINDTIFVFLVTQNQDEGGDPDDPYAEYKVPDDLMW